MNNSHTHGPCDPDPDPDVTPDLDAGGGVPIGSTPPESDNTSASLMEHEPDTRNNFPASGIGTVIAVGVIVVVFLVVAIGLILMVVGVW